MMRITLIHTTRHTQLTIDLSSVSSPLDISRMGDDGRPTERQALRPKEKNTISVGPGVFMVMSGNLGVTADTAEPGVFLAMEVETKDPPPDPPKAIAPPPAMPRMTLTMAKARLGELGVDAQKLHAFIPADRSL
jgi:hypothetical protein